MYRNLFLSSLPEDYLSRSSQHLERVEHSLGEVVCPMSRPVRYVHFPEGALFSTLVLSAKGDSVEAGLAGVEAAVGTQDVLGNGDCSTMCIVQGAGESLRIEAAQFVQEWMREPALRYQTALYDQYFFSQVCQTAMCNRLHPMDKRLARWLLMCSDSVVSDDLRLTQEFIAAMLGVNRPGVTMAAKGLQDAGLIRYSRGHIRILNKSGLVAASCECYKICNGHRNRLIAR